MRFKGDYDKYGVKNLTFSDAIMDQADAAIAQRVEKASEMDAANKALEEKKKKLEAEIEILMQKHKGLASL